VIPLNRSDKIQGLVIPSQSLIKSNEYPILQSLLSVFFISKEKDSIIGYGTAFSQHVLGFHYKSKSTK
jgi:hypothetical protein